MSEPIQPDLSDAVTVFVTTIGDPAFEQCIAHLELQNCTFQLKIIDHVAPMSAAFQGMLDECATPYYVQVDEDMLLDCGAVQNLHERICATDDNVALYVAGLYDVHLDRVIYGLKIFRTEIARRYPIRDIESCEWDQVRRWRQDGFLDIRAPIRGATRDSAHTLGLHGTNWTPRSIYIRFSTLERKRRKGNQTHQWVADEAPVLLKKFLEKPTEQDFYALAGILASSLSDNRTVGREKDYRHYDETPGYQTLCKFVDEVKAGWADGEELDPGQFDYDVLPVDPGG